VDLDWFWRGWFFTTDHVDLAIEDIRWFQVDTRNPEENSAFKREQQENESRDISEIRNETAIPETFVDRDSTLRDFYSDFDDLSYNKLDELEYERYMESLTQDETEQLLAGHHFYEITFRNIGGLVMPLLVEFEYVDGTKEVEYIPAEIWRKNHEKITKVFITEKQAVSVTLDPHLQTADTDLSNNAWPRKVQPSRFELFKRRQFSRENTMQREQRAKEIENE